jgi:hypothetical protein
MIVGAIEATTMTTTMTTLDDTFVEQTSVLLVCRSLALRAGRARIKSNNVWWLLVYPFWVPGRRSIDRVMIVGVSLSGAREEVFWPCYRPTSIAWWTLTLMLTWLLQQYTVYGVWVGSTCQRSVNSAESFNNQHLLTFKAVPSTPARLLCSSPWSLWLTSLCL